MSDSRYTEIKIITRPDGSIANLDFSSYAPDSDAVSAMMQPIIDAVVATAKDDLQQRQQGRVQLNLPSVRPPKKRVPLRLPR